VFRNLIANAIEVEVAISVEDTGPGVPALIASQLFQPFVIAGKKNGMGLALSRKAVISHGGDLWLEERLPV
jgi:signal transduction histidine kinase